MKKLNEFSFPLVAPSLLGAKYELLLDETRRVFEHGFNFLHFDVMDGRFVPNLALNSLDFTLLKKHFAAFYDVHLMVEEPLKWVKEYMHLGASHITIHLEASNRDEIFSLGDLLHQNGLTFGLSLKPNTPLEALDPYLSIVDLILLMSVEPGKGGQSFLPSSYERLRLLKEKVASKKIVIEIDGGINDKTGPEVSRLGADILVSGSYLFKSQDLEEAARLLLNE